MSKKISIYVRNKDITPSSYYRIIQYANYFDGDIAIREIAPYRLYKKHLDLDKDKKINCFIMNIIYYLCMLIRSTYYLILDYCKKPKYIIISKCVCPRYTPMLLKFLINKTTKKTELYWDFDDNIYESGEISKIQAKILEQNSKKIIVTNEFLKSKINLNYQKKVILLPTTDGDMQPFDKNRILDLRKSTFEKEIKLVWVATANNIPNINRILPILEETAFLFKTIYNKNLILTVVCNKKVEFIGKYLIIRNIKWTRKRAQEEMSNSHLGIMPLMYSEYSLGKGGFKLVQYMSVGLPVIASNVGFNKEVVNEQCGILVNDLEEINAWKDAIVNICSDEKKWLKYSELAYQLWLDNFSFEKNLNTWNTLLS